VAGAQSALKELNMQKDKVRFEPASLGVLLVSHASMSIPLGRAPTTLDVARADLRSAWYGARR
jgi:hypothetical protein